MTKIIRALHDYDLSKSGEQTMLTKISRVFVLVLVTSFITACANSQFYHETIMRGQIVGFDKNEIVVCIGTNDGADIGQELQVYRSNWEDMSVETLEGDGYKYEYVGKVKIVSIVNDHFARAKILDGKLNKYDMVEF
jgi:hypothetical protein